MPFRNSKKAGLSAGTNPSGVRRWCEACATKYEGARPVSVSHSAMWGAGPMGRLLGVAQTPLSLFHQWFSIENVISGVGKTLPPTAR